MDLKSILTAVILDFQEAELRTGVPRRLNVRAVPGKATVFIGVRRAGKSTYLFQRIQKLLDAGTPRENILYINFFDDRLHGLRKENLGLVAEAYYSLYPEKKGAETVYCFFDEIQAIEGWEPFVDRLMRTEKCEIFLTGSSARMLSKEIATEMRGRALSWEIFPFSFREFLDYKRIDAPRRLSTKKRLMIQKAFREYWETGGFPEVLGLEPRLRVGIHQEYFHAILGRDLIERHDIRHPRALVDLAHRLIDNVGSLYTVNRLTNYLSALGHKAPKATVGDYLEWFEDAYFLFTVPAFDPSVVRRKMKPKKIYCIDHALVTSVASGVLMNSGHLLENLVFTGLRRVTGRIFYYRTRGGLEVDFLADLPDRTHLLVQVCETLADPQTRKRELAALSEAMAEQGVRTAAVVTREEEDAIETGTGRIEVVPAWRFLLELPES